MHLDLLFTFHKIKWKYEVAGRLARCIGRKIEIMVRINVGDNS